MKFVKDRVKRIELENRTKILKKKHRWDKFRMARNLVINEYMLRKRLLTLVSSIVSLIIQLKFIMVMKRNIAIIEHRKEAQLKSTFMCLKMKQLWRKR